MRPFLLLCGFVLVLSGCTTDTQTRPNIILIMADDLGYETLGVNGGTSYETPNLDALAEEGMRFTHAYATPLCTPSRVQLMTGKYSFRNYIGFGLLDPGERTFGHLMQEAGYRTAVVGKWQLYGNAHQRELAGRGGSLPDKAGFDEYLLWQVKDRGYRFKSPTLDASTDTLRTYPDGYGPDLFADFIGGFMERHRDQPFFVYYPMVLTHDPFQPTPSDSDYATFDPASNLNDTTYFASNMAYMDTIIGRIIDQLNQLGLRDNTLLLFIGDNGTDRKVSSLMGSQRINGHKGYPTDAGTHVPMIASWPTHISPGQVNDNLIDLTDFLPTLLDVAQQELSADFVTDGLSFHDQLTGRAGTTRSWVFCDYRPSWGRFEHRRYVHDKEWKLYDDGSFYHIAEDLQEQHVLNEQDLDTSTRAVKQRFQAVLDRMKRADEVP